MITITEITCCTCGKKTQKKLAEIRRQQKRGKTKFYCNKSCAGKDSVAHLHQYAGKFNTNLVPNNRLDNYSNFRWYIKNIIKNSRHRKQEYNVDIEYLYELWETQKGICPFTKQKLELRTHSYTNVAQPYSASLDRIDNTKGYIKGNVRFVALIFNYAKNSFSDEQVLDFCRRVADQL